MNQEPTIYDIDDVKVDIIRDHYKMINDKQFKRVVKILDRQIAAGNKKKKENN